MSHGGDGHYRGTKEEKVSYDDFHSQAMHAGLLISLTCRVHIQCPQISTQCTWVGVVYAWKCVRLLHQIRWNCWVDAPPDFFPCVHIYACMKRFKKRWSEKERVWACTRIQRDSEREDMSKFKTGRFFFYSWRRNLKEMRNIHTLSFWNVFPLARVTRLDLTPMSQMCQKSYANMSSGKERQGTRQICIAVYTQHIILMDIIAQ